MGLFCVSAIVNVECEPSNILNFHTEGLGWFNFNFMFCQSCARLICALDCKNHGETSTHTQISLTFERFEMRFYFIFLLNILFVVHVDCVPVSVAESTGKR